MSRGYLMLWYLQDQIDDIDRFCKKLTKVVVDKETERYMTKKDKVGFMFISCRMVNFYVKHFLSSVWPTSYTIFESSF